MSPGPHETSSREQRVNLTIDPCPDVGDRTAANPVTSSASDLNDPTLLFQDRGARPPHDVTRCFGDYELLAEIARGGMGVVFKARQASLNRLVALKMILSGQLANDSDVQRFYAEAEAAARLDHPGIVPIFEIGQRDGQHFFSMAFVEGESLARKAAIGPLPPREAAEMVAKVAEAVEFAHQKGIVHRDLKPANILLDRAGQPRVTDFGLAKHMHGDSGLTRSGQIMGTPSYMPPEQAAGKLDEIGPAADIYSLGAILYELLTGRPPFKGASPLETIKQVASCEPVPPRQLQPTVPRDLETICLKCLQKSPAKRYHTAQSLEADLRRYLDGRPVQARPVGPLERGLRWVRRNSAVAALLGALIAVLTGGFVISTLFAVSARFQAGRADAKTEEAKRETAAARTAEAVAREAKTEAQQNAEKARTAAKEAGRREYDAYMLLTQTAWEQHEIGRFLDLLYGRITPLLRNPDGTQEFGRYLEPKGGNISPPSDADLRGFEWAYWRRQMQRGHVALKGHMKRVACVAFSPDGNRLASAGDDQTVKLWDVARGVEVRTINGHTAGVSSVAFAPDGTRLASGSADQTVKLWNVDTGLEILTLKGHTLPVTSVVFDSEGKRLASASADGTVKVWDVATGERVLVLEGHTAGINCVVFSRDGGRIATGSDDHTAKIWDAATGREIGTLKSHVTPVTVVAFSPDGRHLVSACLGGTVLVREAATGKDVARMWRRTIPPLPGDRPETRTLFAHAAGVTGLAFGPKGRRLATASIDRTVQLWNADTGEEGLTLQGHTLPVTTVAFSPDGRRLATGSEDQMVNLWNATLGQETLTLKGHSDIVTGVAFHPQSQRLASQSQDRTVKIWDAATGRNLLTLKHAETAAITVPSLDGKHRHVLANVSSGMAIGSVAFSSDGKQLASASFGNEVQLWEADTGRPTLICKGHTLPVTTVAFRSGGKRLASGSTDATIKVWDAETGHEIFTLKGHKVTVNSVVFNADGNRLASASHDHTVKVWDADKGREILNLTGHMNDVTSVAFSPDGKLLASASMDRTVRIWDAARGQELFRLAGHDRIVSSVTFSPDGQRLATAGFDRTVKVWDTATGLETLTLKGHAGGVTCVAFSADGTRLVSASNDHTVKVWDATNEEK